MTMWLVASALAVTGLVVTLYALFTQGRSGPRRGPEEPDWLVPSPVEVRRARFPLAWRGYDPAHVDVYIDALAAAYEELYSTAGPTVVARARERLALRLGHTSEPASEPASEPGAGPTAEHRENAGE